MIPAKLGAEVIKVEPPGGDRPRQLPGGLRTALFGSSNRNHSLVLEHETLSKRSRA